jgi:hypothetical protein
MIESRQEIRRVAVLPVHQVDLLPVVPPHLHLRDLLPVAHHHLVPHLAQIKIAVVKIYQLEADQVIAAVLLAM